MLMMTVDVGRLRAAAGHARRIATRSIVMLLLLLLLVMCCGRFDDYHVGQFVQTRCVVGVVSHVVEAVCVFASNCTTALSAMDIADIVLVKVDRSSLAVFSDQLHVGLMRLFDVINSFITLLLNEHENVYMI